MAILKVLMNLIDHAIVCSMCHRTSFM